MPHIGFRVSNDIFLKFKEYCKKNKTTPTQLLQDMIMEKLAYDSMSLDDDWKTNASNTLGITVGQLMYAINNGTTVTEVFKRLSDKSDIVTIYPLLNEDTIGLQVSKGETTFVVSAKRQGTKLDMVKKLLFSIEAKLFELLEELHNG